MQDEIWHQFGIQNYNGNVLSVYSVVVFTTYGWYKTNFFEKCSRDFLDRETLVEQAPCKALLGDESLLTYSTWPELTRLRRDSGNLFVKPRQYSYDNTYFSI